MNNHSSAHVFFADMNRIGRIVATVAITVLSVPTYAQAAPAGRGNVEELQYSWRLKGGIRFLAGLVFPTSGIGNLKTTWGENVESELLITAPNGKRGGFYAYESTIGDNGKTLETYSGYAWNDKARSERTVFDYSKGLARIHKETTDEVENRVKKSPASNGEFRDVLTAIYFLRRLPRNQRSHWRPSMRGIETSRMTSWRSGFASTSGMACSPSFAVRTSNPYGERSSR